MAILPTATRNANDDSKNELSTSYDRGARGNRLRVLQRDKLGDIWREIQGASDWKGLLDPIHPLLKAEIMRYGDFAQQCYDSFDNSHSSKYYRNSKRSKSSLSDRLGFLKCGRGYVVTKYIYADTSVLSSFKPSESETGAWMGFIAVCMDPNEIKKLGRRDIVIAWRGTQTSQEWMQNLKDMLVPAALSSSTPCLHIQTISKPDVRIEKGFLSCYTSKTESSVSAREIVVGEITRLLKEYKDEEQDLSITFTGHSLGGALATLSAYDVKQTCMLSDKENKGKNIPVTVFAFASPRLGNLSFAKHVDEIGVKVLRLVNKGDFVPKVPGVFLNENMGWLARILHWLPWTYFHVGNQITLDSSSSPLLKRSYNPADFHNLEVYLHLLDGCQGTEMPFKSSGLRDPALVNKHSDLLIEKLQILHNWWPRRNKEVVRRIDGMWVYSPKTPTPVPLQLQLQGRQLYANVILSHP